MGVVPNDIVSLCDDWTDLAERSANLFATHDWAVAWWRHFGDGCEPRVERVDGDGRAPVALLPLYTAGRRLRRLSFIGSGPADQLGPVCAPGDRPAAATRLSAALAEPGHDLFVGERLPGDERWPALIQAAAAARESSPTVRLETSDWDAYLASRSANLRGQARRFERRLAREHELRFRLSDEPARLGADLELLFKLHELRFGAGATEFTTPAHRAFHVDFAARALERGWLRLWILELDGRPAATWYGFRFGAAEWYYQSGRDPALERLSVGAVLFVHTLREAVRDGMREYKLLRGDESYKNRYATDDAGLDTIVVARTARARLWLAARAARSRAARARARLRPEAPTGPAAGRARTA